MKDIPILVLCTIVNLSIWAYKPIKNTSSSFCTNQDAVTLYKNLNGYKAHLTAYKELFKEGKLSYKHYPAHVYKRELIKLQLNGCEAGLEWVERGERMVRALNSRSNLHNDVIYEVYWVKIIDVVEECLENW